jgi:thiol:disulfide interchange protein
MHIRKLPLQFFLMLALACWCSQAALAQKTSQTSVTAPHVTVRLLVPPAQIYPGEKFLAGLDFKLEEGWHVYWTNAGDSGEPPGIDWKLPQGITAGAMQFPAPRRLPLGPLMDFGYEDEVVFPVPIEVGDANYPAPMVPIGGHVTWLVCREVCIPGKADLRVWRDVVGSDKNVARGPDAAAQALIAKYQALEPKELPAGDTASFQPTARGFVLDVTTGAQQASAQFFPLDETVIANAAPQPAKALTDGVELTLTRDENIQAAPRTLNGVIELANGAAYVVHATPAQSAASGAPAAGALSGLDAIGQAAALAFLGGILLNLMPCVFPVLFIKGLALVQSSQQERRQLRAHGWMYTLGILVSFWAVVGVLLVLRAAGRQLGWGFQFQSPVFLALMAMLLFFLGLALAGQFEIGLSLTRAGGTLAQQHGYAGSFFTGVLAMVVATPCTAPFMGAAVGYALAHSAAVSFAVFTALGLGLAVPYLALAYFPGWARLLPQPGAWMEILKQAVAVPIFGTVIWLVWVFAQIAGTNALIGLLAAFLLLAVAGWVLGRWPGERPAAATAAVVLLAAIAAPVWAVRHLGTAAAAAAGASQQTASGWEPFTPALVAQDRAQGRAVFVDFTASWCLSCQVNERVILDSAAVKQHLKDSGVALVRADWTNQDADITKALAALGRSGVPTYAIYPADPAAQPQVLPEVLTQRIVIDALNSLQNQQRQSAILSRPTQ